MVCNGALKLFARGNFWRDVDSTITIEPALLFANLHMPERGQEMAALPHTQGC